MLFNSIDFLIFLPVVFFLYWFVTQGNLRRQNVLLLCASYIFYGWWDWRFLGLIVLSSLVDYWVGLGLQHYQAPRLRKRLLLVSLLVNLGSLGLFKYFNFFVSSFSEAFTLFGFEIDSVRLNLVLPVGISFYTFQTLSYTIDVYRGKFQPITDFVAFFAFVSFFPQLVAGPIERASNLLPQFSKQRSFKRAAAIDGLRQILWGFFKKIVIADNLAIYVNLIFDNHQSYPGSTLLLGSIFFAFQIYGDFSGYSDIAIGTARLFGFHLMRNFAFPYFSRDVAEFWRRWHISLSTWFRDYVYIPLGGSRGPVRSQIFNVIVVFLVSGLWHGANWTFVAWGGLNALYFLPLLLRKRNRVHTDLVAESRELPTLRETWQMVSTFLLTAIAWIFFRSESIAQAIEIVATVFSRSLFQVPDLVGDLWLYLVLVNFVLVEWIQRHREHVLQLDAIPQFHSKMARWSFYYLLIFAIMFFGGHQQEFVYFQF